MHLKKVLPSNGLFTLLIILIGVYVFLSLNKFTNNFTDQEKYKYFPVFPNRSKQVCKDSCDGSDIMCQPRRLPQWEKLMSSPKVHFKPFLSDGQYIFPWERDYLKFPPLVDSKTLPDLALSTFNMAGGNGKEVGCDVGQRLTGRLDVRDGYGRRRHDGMDEVRIWIVDTANTSQRAVGQVEDFRNGSYGLEITCLWPGTLAELRVAVSYPREFIRAVIDQVNRGVTRYTAGLFTSKRSQEVTVCHPSPILSGRDCLCNFTSFNTREYYCGKPLDRRLNCSHWMATYLLPLPRPYKVTRAERLLIIQIPGPVSKRTLKTKLLIRTFTRGHLPSVPKCSCTSAKITWDMTKRPQGFWNSRGEWESLQCQTSRFPGQGFPECLRNAQIYIIGDSNANRMFGQFIQETNSIKTMDGSWPGQAEAANRVWNITVKFRPHEYPLFLKKNWTPLLRYGSVEHIIDGVPSRGRQLVVLHYYLHLTPFHLSVARSRMEAAARAISRLLTRNPEARVALRGPHVTSRDWDINHTVGGDALGKHFADIISAAFAQLKDRVVFLDGWEMTTALENAEFHPDNRVPREMILMFMSFICKQ